MGSKSRNPLTFYLTDGYGYNATTTYTAQPTAETPWSLISRKFLGKFEFQDILLSAFSRTEFAKLALLRSNSSNPIHKLLHPYMIKRE